MTNGKPKLGKKRVAVRISKPQFDKGGNMATTTKTKKKRIVRTHPAEGRSIIEDMCNLVCPDGHLHYSPEPYSFVGSECTTAKEPGGAARCHKRLVFLRNSRDIPKPKKKSKLRKMKRF